MELLKKITNESEEEINKYLKTSGHKDYIIEVEESPITKERLFNVYIPILEKSEQSQVLRDLSSILNKKCRKHSNNLTEFHESRSRMNIMLRVGVSK